MSKKKAIEEELSIILQILQQFPEGANLQQIIESAKLPIGLRTLQRRLEKLRDLGKVVISGKTSGARYTLVHQGGETRRIPSLADELIPLSDEAKSIISFVSRPTQQRDPVGYNLEFLESYRPNIDQYLTNQELVQLEKMGSTTASNQPAGTYAREILHRLLIDLSWNSSRLEGNTYSLLDTERLILQG